MLLVSLLIHALLLSIRFEPQHTVYSLPSLEIILVPEKTRLAHKPQSSKVLAQKSADKGGEREVLSRVPAKSAWHSPSHAEKVSQKVVAELEQKTREVMTQVNSVEKSAPANSDTSARASQPALDMSNLLAEAREMSRLEFITAKQAENYQQRPRRKFIGVRTQEYPYALYVEGWRQKIEGIGKLNYPEAAQQKKIYGQLVMTVSLNADGTIAGIEINRTSGEKMLDDAAKTHCSLRRAVCAFFRRNA